LLLQLSVPPQGQPCDAYVKEVRPSGDMIGTVLAGWRV
jgi:hypothetical protein